MCRVLRTESSAETEKVARSYIKGLGQGYAEEMQIGLLLMIGILYIILLIRRDYPLIDDRVEIAQAK